MTKLIEEGHVFIAQPPLYKIKRKKKEMYVENDEKMNSMLLDWGSEDLNLVQLKPKKTFTDKQFRSTLDILEQLEIISHRLKRKNIKIKDLLENRNKKTKTIPIYKLTIDNKVRYVYSDKELAKLTGADTSKQKEINIDEDGSGIKVDEIFESHDIMDIAKELDKKGIDIDDYIPSEKAIYKIESEDKKIEIFALNEILDFVKVQGRKGLSIQRYKGLGEMNPHQLWETTMDPSKRTLLSVNLDDVVEADEIFTILMGDQVEPRRDFIEKHAHEVKNLDI